MTRKEKDAKKVLIALAVFMLFIICTAICILLDWYLAGMIFELLTWVAMSVAISLKPSDE